MRAVPGVGLRGEWTVRRAIALSVAREEAVGARASELTESDGVPVPWDEGAGVGASAESRARAGTMETALDGNVSDSEAGKLLVAGRGAVRVDSAAEGERVRFEPAVGLVEAEGASRWA